MTLRVNPRGRPPLQLAWTGNDFPILVSGDDPVGRILSGDNLVRTVDDGPGMTFRVGLDPIPALVSGFITYTDSGDFIWIPNTFASSGDLATISGDIVGIIEGEPGDFTYTLVASAPNVVRNIGPDLREPKIAKRARKYVNTSNVAAARIQGSIHEAASEGTEIHYVYSLDAFTTDGVETGVFMRADRVNFPEPGAYLPLVSGAIGPNVCTSWAVKGGSGTALVKVSDLFVDMVSSDSPPASPSGDAPEFPGGGIYGMLIHDLNSQTIGLDDSDPVTFFPDDGPYGIDGVPDGSVSQAAPTYDATGWDGSLPAVIFDGADDGLTLFDQITANSFTTYIVAKDIVVTAGTLASFWNGGNGYPFGKGVFFGNGTLPTDMGAHVNTNVFGNTFVWVDDDFDKTDPHIYRFTFNKPTGLFSVFVDGVLKISNTCNPQFTATTRIYMGRAGGDCLSMTFARELTYDAYYATAGLNAIELALKAIWGTP